MAVKPASKKPSSSGKAAAIKAIHTDKMTNIMFRAMTLPIAKRWRFSSFRGPKGRESAGVVDVVAIRRNTKRAVQSGDLFDLLFIQMKGGTAKMPSPSDRERLMAVKRRYSARDVVLFVWKKGHEIKWGILNENMEWEWRESAKEIFG